MREKICDNCIWWCPNNQFYPDKEDDDKYGVCQVDTEDLETTHKNDDCERFVMRRLI